MGVNERFSAKFSSKGTVWNAILKCKCITSEDNQWKKKEQKNAVYQVEKDNFVSILRNIISQSDNGRNARVTHVVYPYKCSYMNIFLFHDLEDRMKREI